MAYIPLIEHTHPRVLMLDFSPQDVAKIQQAGFEASRGATGLHDRNEFCLPFAIQDVEVLFAQVKTGSFISKDRTASANSVEERPFFRDLMREIWQKAGWSVLFISQNTAPEELGAVGLDRLGIISHDREHMPESIREPYLKFFEEYRRQNRLPELELPSPQMPRFTGQAVHVSDELEASILQRYIKSARMSFLTCLKHPNFVRDTNPQPHIVAFHEAEYVRWLIRDDSADGNVLALSLDNSIPVGRDGNRTIHNQGRILLLPDFEDNNGNVAMALLQEAITQISPHLFDTPQHPWLEKYQPAPVLHLLAEREMIINETLQKIEQLDNQVETEREKYAWLLGLLVSFGNQFAIDVAQTLRFLGFEVEEIDNNLAPGERRREDLWIWDKATDYFALGEAKTTGKGRGAAEDFITKTQTHQARYARENRQVPPPALLIVNYAIDLDPSQRTGRFYQMEVAGRLEDNGITALNSTALFDLCQCVLNKQLSKEQVRRFIMYGHPLISSITLEEVVAVSESPTP